MQKEYIPEESIGYLSGKLKREVGKYISRELQVANAEVTTEQLWLLLILSREDGHNQQDIADLFSKDKTSIARMVQHMEKEGYLTRKPKEDDKRNNLLYITPKGVEVKDKYLHIVMDVLGQAESAVPKEEFEQCKGTLREVIAHLRELNCKACKKNQ